MKQLKSIDRNFTFFLQIRTLAITHWIQTEGFAKPNTWRDTSTYKIPKGIYLMI